MWRDSTHSVKVFLGGLYALICWRALLAGGDVVVQPLTLVAGACLVAMLSGVVVEAVALVKERLATIGWVVLGIKPERREDVVTVARR